MLQVLETRSLYEQDILLWVEDTVTKLKARDFDHLDLENLIEEVESLGILQKRELRNRLTTLIEHVLKRVYVPLPENYRGWENTIREQRRQLYLILNDAPSLKSIWQESFDLAWDLAIKDLREEYSKVKFPLEWPYSREVESVLNQKLWD
jgi:hypothetical protein